MSWGAVVGAVGSVAGGLLGGKSSGGGGNKFVRREGKDIIRQSRDMNVEVAPQNADQLAAYDRARQSVGMFDPAFNRAQERADMLAQGISPDNIRQFYNPYENDVIGAYLADLNNMRREQDVAVSDAARAAKAFGGDREAVYRASVQGDLDRTGAMTLANLRQSGYNNAADLAMRNLAAQQSGNAQYLNAVQNNAINYSNDTQRLQNVGDILNWYEQRRLDAPRDTLDWRMGLLSQQAPATRGTTQNQQITGALQGFEAGGDVLKDILGTFGWGGGGTSTPAKYGFGP